MFEPGVCYVRHFKAEISQAWQLPRLHERAVECPRPPKIYRVNLKERSHPSWRWIPLSLRMFVAALVILGAGSALSIGVPAWRQWGVIQRVNGLGGSVEYHNRGPAWLHAVLGGRSRRLFCRGIGVRQRGHVASLPLAVVEMTPSY